MTGYSVLELLSKQGEEERRFEIVSTAQVEVEADRFYDEGYYVTVHDAGTRQEAAAVIAHLL